MALYCIAASIWSWAWLVGFDLATSYNWSASRVIISIQDSISERKANWTLGTPLYRTKAQSTICDSRSRYYSNLAETVSPETSRSRSKHSKYISQERFPPLRLEKIINWVIGRGPVLTEDRSSKTPTCCRLANTESNRTNKIDQEAFAEQPLPTLWNTYYRLLHTLYWGMGDIKKKRLGQKSYWQLSKEYTRND
jgi:hypothetical protein